jgi:hypothetical protein
MLVRSKEGEVCCGLKLTKEDFSIKADTVDVGLKWMGLMHCCLETSPELHDCSEKS